MLEWEGNGQVPIMLYLSIIWLIKYLLHHNHTQIRKRSEMQAAKVCFIFFERLVNNASCNSLLGKPKRNMMIRLEIC